MAESGGWLEPSYLPTIFERFRDHLPFGVWPFALAIRLWGDRGVALIALLCSLGTLSLILLCGARVFGRPAAVVGALVLASTETWFRYAAAPTLDCLLLVLVTAATLPLWSPAPMPASRWAWSAALTALAVLVKGPFGLLPLCATTLGRALVLRSPRDLWAGGVSAAVALLPAAGFLAWDNWLGTVSWWHGYVIDQLYASAVGLRSDGEPGLVPMRTLAGRFWPGLPLAVWGMAVGLRDLARRKPSPASMVAVHAISTVGLLCLPSRKIWHHALVVYPALAVLAGTAAAPLLERMLAFRRRARTALVTLALLAAALLAASAAGAGAWLTPRVCIVPPALAGLLPVDSDVLVVAPGTDWRALAALAAEHRLVPWPTASLAGDVPLVAGSGLVSPGHRALAALVRDDLPPASHCGWRQGRHEGNWTLWTRAP